jgi:hypothetical protein
MSVRIFEDSVLTQYGCETWSLIVREQDMLRVWEKMVVEGDVWTEERGSDRGLETIT